MKVKSDLSFDFFKIYLEAREIAKHKKVFLSGRGFIKFNFLEEVLLYSLIIFMIGFYIAINPNYLYLYGYMIIFTGVLYLLGNLVRIYEGYKFRKRKNFLSEMIIDERGITDLSSFDGVELLFKWCVIEGIICGRYSVVILTKKRVYFYFDIKEKNRIIKNAKKYNSEVLVINHER